MTMELLCTRDLALRLGAIEPETPAATRELKRAGHMLLRDIETNDPLFWPVVGATQRTDNFYIERRSS